MDGVDDLSRVGSLQVDRCDPEVGMPELSLDDRQPELFVCHLDGGRLPEVVRREPPPYPSLRGEPAQRPIGGRGSRGVEASAVVGESPPG
jgi:hypothetical protein